MSKNENKVQFNLKNVAYAPLTQENGAVNWGVPVMIPGAVTLTMDPQGDVTPFYADGIVYYQSVANSGDCEWGLFRQFGDGQISGADAERHLGLHRKRDGSCNYRKCKCGTQAVCAVISD